MTGRPPVIVVGMHRSGTSLLTRLLDEVGLFVGRDLEGHAESRHFQRINRWMLDEVGVSWDHPETLADLPDHPDIVEAMATHVRFLLSSPRSAGYLGWLRYLRVGSPANLERPWGWKDPRSTILLPVWSEVFPEARIVHIRRHGVDIANSLRDRHSESIEVWEGRDASVEGLDGLVQWLRPGWYPPRDDIVGSLRSLDLEGGLGIWEAYLDLVEDALADHAGPVTDLRYEDLVEDPGPHLEDLADFCRLDPDPEAVHEAAARIDPGRARRYLDDPELAAFARDHAAALERWGFEVPDDA